MVVNFVGYTTVVEMVYGVYDLMYRDNPVTAILKINLEETGDVHPVSQDRALGDDLGSITPQHPAIRYFA